MADERCVLRHVLVASIYIVIDGKTRVLDPSEKPSLVYTLSLCGVQVSTVE